MSKAILPDSIRNKIRDLFREGYSSVEVYDSVADEAKDLVDSHEQLSRCIASIKGKRPGKRKGDKEKAPKSHLIPRPKAFDSRKHTAIINSLSERVLPAEVEHACQDVAIDILTNYEGFKEIEDANKAEGFSNPPFDYLGFKEGKPYLIEFKGSLHGFNAPGETQKRRLKELLKRIERLNVALLQVKLREGEYRIFYDDEMNLFFDGKRLPLKPIEDWIRARI